MKFVTFENNSFSLLKFEKNMPSMKENFFQKLFKIIVCLFEMIMKIWTHGLFFNNIVVLCYVIWFVTL